MYHLARHFPIPPTLIAHRLTAEIATYSVVINDLGDNGNVTSGRSVVDENNSADLDESLESGWLLGLDISSLCLFTAVQLVGQAEQLQSVSFSP